MSKANWCYLDIARYTSNLHNIVRQAGAGVVPSSGLARSWSKVEVSMKPRWSLDVKVWNILQRFFLIGGQECVKKIPFPVWIIQFPVYKTGFGRIDWRYRSIKNN